jgi:hypothetical protein
MHPESRYSQSVRLDRSMMIRLPRLLLLLVLLPPLAAACASPAPAAGSLQGDQLPVDAQLETFWQDHGGLATFGPPLQAAQLEGSVMHQVMLNGELVFDSRAQGGSPVYLAPLGTRLGLAQPAESPPSDPGARYFELTGHTLFVGFSQAFDELGGLAVVGPPIAEVSFPNGLVVQYFENLGLYRDQAAAPADVHLLAYGLAALNDAALQPPAGFQAVLPPELRPRPFAPFLDRYGGEAVFGQPLSDPRLASDGSLEQVYQGAVLYAPQNRPADVMLRPLGSQMGPADPPAPRSDDPDALYFSETGHNVGWAFAQFYKSHGGQAVLGLPMGEAQLEAGAMKQRYENAVLEYRFDLPSRLAIQLAPLGVGYLQAQASGLPTPTSLPQSVPATEPASGGPIRVEASVQYPILPPGTAQQFDIGIYLPDGSPWPGVIPLIVIHAPLGDRYPEVGATDSQGQLRFTLNFDSLQAGQIVDFEVAVAGSFGLGYAEGQFAGGVRGAQSP